MLQNRPMKYTDSVSMNLRTMLVLVAVVPLSLAVLAVVGVVKYQFDQLAQNQSVLTRPILLQARKDEIQHFVQVGRRAVGQLGAGPLPKAEAQRQALEMLRRMDFGEDSYFFVYDLEGKNLMHPRLPNFEGRNHWELRDKAGNPIIQQLTQQALAGGGFVDYMWQRPSTGADERKLGYVELIPEWGWMIGSGLYLDHLKETQELIAVSTAKALAQTRDQVLLIASAALLAVTAGGLLLNWREQRRADKRLRFMAQQVVHSQEEERTRVSRELHDGISQMLAALKFSLESTLLLLQQGQPKTVEMLQSSIQMLTTSMHDVRRISHNLRPALLDDMDLGRAVEQIAREFSERTQIMVHLQISPLPLIAEGLATAVFRVVQEALSNIEKHAQAKHVNLQLSHETKRLGLMISDDGRGFDVSDQFQQARSGLGLTNMRERIEMLGGEYELTSLPGSTTLRARIPMSLAPGD
jgi:two-component system, NarL family, sensor kinase